MYSFKNDYSEGAHPRILEALINANMVQTDGYSLDIYTKQAIEVLKDKIGRNDIDIHLIPGGTQTNLTTISAFLRPYEAAIAVNTGHIFVHETGAIEATGHKVVTAYAEDGKLTPELVESVLELHVDEHMVIPKLVYISDSTEIGTLYTKSEIQKLSECCKKNDLILFVDGARLGSALCAEGNDLTLSDLGKYTDAFYIGGTKNGALIGEALVICNDSLKKDFRYNIKQKGALLAKSKLLGIQFLELFRDNLFFDLAIHANKMATILKEELSKCGVSFLTDSYTNQIFPIFSNELIEKIGEHYAYTFWEKVDEKNSVLRLVTSWATLEDKVYEFINFVKNNI